LQEARKPQETVAARAQASAPSAREARRASKSDMMKNDDDGMPTGHRAQKEAVHRAAPKLKGGANLPGKWADARLG